MFVSSWRHSCSSVPSSAGPYNPKPALLISTSIRPCVDTVAATTASTSAGTVTSSRAGWIRPSKPAMTAAASRAGSRIVATTVWPRPAIKRAAAAPKPREAPVMRTTWGSMSGADARQDQGALSL